MSEIDLLIQELRDTIDNQKEEIDRLNNIIKKAIKYINSFGGEWKNYSLYYREIMNNLLNILTLKENNK